MSRPLAGALLLLAGAAGAQQPPGPLEVTSTPEGQVRVQARGPDPGLLELHLHPPGQPEAGLRRRVAIPAGGETLRLTPPGPGTYQYQVQLTGLAFGEPQPLGARGNAPGHFRDPGHLAVSPDGDLLVADRANGRIQVLTGGGRFRFSLGELQLAGRARGSPGGLAMTPAGRLVVLDARGARLLRFSLQGRPLGEAALPPALRRPGGVAVLRDREAVLALPRSDQVVVVGFDGELRRRLAGFGAAAARVRGPQDVATDGSGFWVSESRARRIQHLAPGGGSTRQHQGSLKSPAGLALDPRGLVLVADRGTRGVHLFDPDSGELAVLAAGLLGDPVDVAALPGGDLVVSDRRRSLLWRLPFAGAVTYKKGQVQTGSVR